MKNILCLCDELILEILKHLCFKDIGSLVISSKHLSYISQDDTLWSELLYKHWRVTYKKDYGYSNCLQLYKRIVMCIIPKRTLSHKWSGFAQWTEPLAHPQNAHAHLVFKPGDNNCIPSIVGIGTTINRATLPWYISEGKFQDLTVSWIKHVDGHTCHYTGHLNLFDGSLCGEVTYNEVEKGINWYGNWRYDVLKDDVLDVSPLIPLPSSPHVISNRDLGSPRQETTKQDASNSVVRWVFDKIKMLRR